MNAEGANEIPLIAGVPLRLSKRRPQDVIPGVVFCALVALTCVLGLRAYTTDADMAILMQLPPAECFAPPVGNGTLGAASGGHESDKTAVDSGEGTRLRAVTSQLPTFAVMAVALAIAGMCWLLALRSHTSAVVYGTLLLIPGGNVATAACLASRGSLHGAILFACLAVVSLLVLVAFRRRLALSIQLMREAASALAAHPALVLAALLILAAWIVLMVLLTAMIIVHVATGRYIIVRAEDSSATAQLCVFELPAEAQAGISVTVLVILWTTAVAHQLRTFVVALVTACWYYDPSHGETLEAAVASALADPGRTMARRAPVRTALRLGVTKSFGSLCLGGLVLVACEIVNSAVRMARRGSSERTMMSACVECCLQALSGAVEYVNKFATVHVAITGDGFCPSARAVTRLLSRRTVGALTVDSVSSYVLHASAAAVALAVGLGMMVLCRVAQPSLARGELPDVAVAELGALAFALALCTLGFCASLLLNMIDAAFVCHALDEESGMDCRPTLRAAIVAVHSPRLVEHPVGIPSAIGVPVASDAQRV